MIRGTTVELLTRRRIGLDGFNVPIWEELPVPVHDVLISPSSDTERADALNLYGKRAVYTLAVPKGDANDWENRRVRFFGKEWVVILTVQEGIEENIPLRWNRKVIVARYE